jgi:CHASE3 domain sensor protein
VEIGMNLKKVLLELSVSEVQQILAIDLDRDAEKALAFIRENLGKKVKKALRPH